MGGTVIALIVKLRVQPGTEEQCKQYMRTMEENTRREPGCLMYVAHQSTDDPSQLAFYEQYTDEAAFDAHRNAPYFAQFVTNGLNKFVVSRERMLCEPIS